MKYVSVLAAASLAACATTADMQRWERNAIAEAQGKTVDHAIARFGIPSNEQTINGRRVLTWRDDESRGLFCQMVVMYDARGVGERASLEGMNGPCLNWLARRNL